MEPVSGQAARCRAIRPSKTASCAETGWPEIECRAAGGHTPARQMPCRHLRQPARALLDRAALDARGRSRLERIPRLAACAFPMAQDAVDRFLDTRLPAGKARAPPRHASQIAVPKTVGVRGRMDDPGHRLRTPELGAKATIHCPLRRSGMAPPVPRIAFPFSARCGRIPFFQSTDWCVICFCFGGLSES